MSAFIRSGEASFEPRARLLKLLGGELIRDEVMAVIELVKNAHDADASEVTLEFLGVADGTGSITIHDDGYGMDVDTLLGSWMQPAGSMKSREDRHYTPSGRRVLGEKGVGRFAIDRLGRSAELVSRRRGSRAELVAVFDWDEYDDISRPLSEVKSSWFERRPEVFTGRRSGTQLTVLGVRGAWQERKFRRLCTRLGRLLSPFHGKDSFVVRITSDEFPDYSNVLETSLLGLAPYRIRASFDGASTVKMAFNDGEPVASSWLGEGDLTCGPVEISMNAFDLDTSALARIASPAEVRRWLREWSGISVYRDGFRVLPYGEPDDDWLRLDQRRVNNPVLRLSNNQVCGFISISRDGNPELRDQTNRGGLLQSRAFEDLRRLVVFVIQHLEQIRQGIRHPEVNSSVRRKGKRGEDCQNSVATDLINLSSMLDGRPGARGALESLAKRIRDESVERARLEAFRHDELWELAGLGHMATTLHHAIGPRLDALEARFRDLRSSVSRPVPELDALKECISDVREVTRLYRDLLPATTQQRRVIDLVAEVNRFRDANARLLADCGIQMDLSPPTEMVLRTEFWPEKFQQILLILLWNSLEWLPHDGSGRIEVSFGSTDDSIQLIFTDNGPGIEAAYRDRIFEPGFSLKENGRGMGLFIARRILSTRSASILSRDDQEHTGARFQIDLRRKGSRSVGRRRQKVDATTIK